MLTIIEIQSRSDGSHGLQSQSGRKRCWLEGWVEVPKALEKTVWACGGRCQLTLEQGVLTAVTPLAAEEESPAEEEGQA